MNNYLMVVPNENEKREQTLKKVIQSEQEYIDEISEFCVRNIGMEGIDLNTNLIKIAQEGYMVMKIFPNSKQAMCFLPIYVSNDQYNYLYNNVINIQKCSNFEGYYLKVENNKLYCTKTNDLNKFVLIANKKNMILDKKRSGIIC